MMEQRNRARLSPGIAAVGVAVELLLAAGLIGACALVAFVLNLVHRG